MKRLNTLFILFSAAWLGGQSFEFVEANPFNIQIINFMDTGKLAMKYDFTDTDRDGDPDLILMGLDESDSSSVSLIYNLRYFLEYQENIGTRTVPLFNLRENRFPAFTFPKGKGFMIPTVGDLNGDGYVDFVVSSEVDLYNEQYLQFQVSNGQGGYTTTNCLDWGLDPFPAFSFLIPKLADLDNDGDLDILLGGYRREYNLDNEPLNVPVYFYAKNVGNAQNPEFLGWFENPYDLVPLTEQSAFTVGDIDLDGDVDVLSFDADEDGVIVVHFTENIAGPGQKPRYAAPVVSPFGLPAGSLDETFLFPELTDIDTDGDLDLFFLYLTEEITELRFYRNNDCVPDSKVIEVSLCAGEVYEFNNQIFSEAGDYFIETASPSGCITVTHLKINKIPDLTVNVQINGIELSTPDVPGYMYRWFDCTSGVYFPAATTYRFTAPYTGLFAVEITDPQGCVHVSDCISVTVTGTSEEPAGFQLFIAPNPSDGVVHFWNNQSLPVKNVLVYNQYGIKLNEGLSMEKRLDLTGMIDGLYFVRFDYGDFTVVRRVIIQK